MEIGVKWILTQKLLTIIIIVNDMNSLKSTVSISKLIQLVNEILCLLCSALIFNIKFIAVGFPSKLTAQ